MRTLRYTDNPSADFLAHDIEQEKALAKLPHCDDCGEPIQDDEAYYYHGDVICEDCMSSYKRTVTID